jgi:chitinase
VHPTRLLAATLLLVSSAVAVPGRADAATAGLTAAFSAADYGTYWVDKYVVTNPTTASITGWTLEFDMPAGLTVGQGYNGLVTRAGNHVTVTTSGTLMGALSAGL